ncbi:MAG: FAD-dependent oxidoreductase, partial [Cyanobacteria bacterium P01_A01_bin.17]
MKSDTVISDPLVCPVVEGANQYDVIVFGDEVPGVMTALKVKRELRLRGVQSRVALLTEGNIDNGIGGHLVRGGLAYLDRNQVPKEKRSKYGVFGQPNRLYQEFLGLGRVKTIALDRFTVAQGFERALNGQNIDVIGNVELQAANSVGNLVCSLTASGKTYTATQFVDASQSGELAEASGVEMMQGLEALGFPDSTLSIGLIFELYGVDIEQLKATEARLIERFTDPNDAEAQRWLAIACGPNEAKGHDLVQSLTEKSSDPKLLYTGTEDSADVRSLAFSIAMHGRLGREYDLKSSGFLFDRANIAVLPDRLSFNALLFYANAEQARQLSTSGAKPTVEMLEVATQIKALFERLGMTRVEVMDELYVRNAGQIANPLDELSATLMTAGGVPASEALGTFGYHLDDRGGIDGLDEQVQQSSLRSLNFRQLPIFNYGFRHALPTERQNLAVLGPASGFGGLGTTAGRIVELNVGVGEGLAIAISKAISEKRSLHTIQNIEVREAMGYVPAIYGEQTGSFQ